MSLTFTRNKKPQRTPKVCHAGPGPEVPPFDWPGSTLQLLAQIHTIDDEGNEYNLIKLAQMIKTPLPGVYQASFEHVSATVVATVTINPDPHTCDVMLLTFNKNGETLQYNWSGVNTRYPEYLSTATLADASANHLYQTVRVTICT